MKINEYQELAMTTLNPEINKSVCQPTDAFKYTDYFISSAPECHA
jgi:hypothetical protein